MELSVLRLSWVLIGSCNNFWLMVERTASVSNVRNALISSFPTQFAGSDTEGIQLYLAKQNEEWIDERSPEAMALMEGDETVVDAICGEILPLQDTVGQRFEHPERGKLHLLVRIVAPVRLGKRTRDDKVYNQRLWCLIDDGARSWWVKVTYEEAFTIRDLEHDIKSIGFKNNLLVQALPLRLYTVKDMYGGWLAKARVSEIKEHTGKHFTGENVVREEIDPDLALEDVFRSSSQDDMHVLVVAPYFVVEEDEDDTSAAKEAFEVTAETLKTEKEVDQLVDIIKRASVITTATDDDADVRTKMSCIVLDNPSGTGKTQMAFTLMARKELEVLYVVYGEDRQGSHLTFSCRLLSFLRCVREDLLTIENGEATGIRDDSRRYIFGFILSLLRGVPKFTDPRTRREVWEDIASRSLIEPQPVLFIDDFPRIDDNRRDANERAIELLVDALRSVGLTVILSGATGVSSDIVRVITKYLGGSASDQLECIITPSLPLFQHPDLDSQSQDLRKIIRHSQPSFARAAMEYVLQVPPEDTNFVEYVDTMVRALVSALVNPEWLVRETSFLIGQVMFYLATCHCDADLTKARLIVGHFARLREQDPFELWFKVLQGNPVKTRGGDVWYRWYCPCRFPRDPLLHLCFVGSFGMGAFAHSDKDQIPFSRAFERAGNAVDNVMDFSNPDQATNDGMRLEACVAGSIVVASHRGGLTGISFPSFFSALLYELGISPSVDQMVLNLDLVLNAMSSYQDHCHERNFCTVPFLATIRH